MAKRVRQSSESTPSTSQDTVVPGAASRLPLEMISLILAEFDWWGEENMGILQNCSLVSPLWKTAAQNIIFNRIEVNGADDCKFWSKKFREYPHLGSYVVELRLTDPKDDCLEIPYIRGRAIKNLIGSLNLKKVRKLELENITRWGPVEQRLVKQFQWATFLWVENVRGMSRSRDLPDLVDSLPNLTEFTVGAVGEEYDEAKLEDIQETGLKLREWTPQNGKPRVLEGLSVWDAEIAVDKIMWLLNPAAFDLSQLQALWLCWSDFGDDETISFFSALDELFQSVGPHTETLLLQTPVPHYFNEISNPLEITDNPFDKLTAHLSNPNGPLQHLATLKHITFQVDLRISSVSFGLNAMLTMLTALSSRLCPDLQRISFFSGVHPRPEPIPLYAPDWEALDNLFVCKSFPNLIAVTFIVNAGVKENGSTSKEFWVNRPKKAINSFLHRTREKGILEIFEAEEYRDLYN